MKFWILIFTLALTMATLACPGGMVPPEQVGGSSSAMTSPDHDHGEHAHKDEKVQVAKDGSKFDPPVAAEKIPNEAWACVMGGKVHYASMTKGNGKCPLCGMNLVQHAAHQK